MMARFLVASRSALAELMRWVPTADAPVPKPNEHVSDECVAVHEEGSVHLLHRDDVDAPQVAVVSLDAVEAVHRERGTAAYSRLLARIDRVTRNAGEPPLALPPQWRTFHHDNLLAFFALPRSGDHDSVRWVAEILSDRSVAFWRLTRRDAELRLAEFAAEPGRADELVRAHTRLLKQRSDLLASPASPIASRLQSLVDLTAVGAGSVTKGRQYSMWLDELTPGQRDVLNHDAAEPLKVRGAAGSGKTLVLELKALREAYEARDDDREVRILYVTHSWALAQQVDEAIRSMDERRLPISYIEVMPLVAIREIIHGPLPAGVDLLGEDSLEGKKAQLELISESVDVIASTDVTTYREVAPTLLRGVESGSGSPDRLRLCFDLMREFIEVMDPNQIKPGVNSLAKYLELDRQPWMIDLPTRGSRELVFGVYREYVGRLVEEGQITTDQALDDFRRYLESYTWNIRREQSGYDLLLIDEFHLFNDTERYILHLLTRDPESFPRMIMAMDPRQSAFALLTGQPGATDWTKALPGMEAEERGSVQLTTTHRFTPRIHTFVSHLHKSFPNLVSLGEDWEVDIGRASRTDTDDRPVEVKLFSTEASLIAYTLEQAVRENAQAEAERVAIIGVGVHDLDRIATHLRSAPRLPVTVIESRDDVELLRYSRKTVVVTAAEFAAGLQFSVVVVVSVSPLADAGLSSSSDRVTLSQLYLASTRAMDHLLLASMRGDHGVPQLLQGAVDAGAATVIN
jgi:hypothetical protein